MTEKKTSADFHALAELRGFAWLGTEAVSAHTKTLWRCSKGHEWMSHRKGLEQGYGCPYCSGRIKKTPADYDAVAQRRGFKWIGPAVPTTKDKTAWECASSHCWQSSYNNISGGSGCPFCAGQDRKTPRDYEHLAASLGFTWLGPEVSNSQTKTEWRCSKGHTFLLGYATVHHRRRCPKCGIERRSDGKRIPVAGYHAVAAQNDLVWLGPEVPNQNTKTRWRCAHGHEYEAIYSNVKQGSGCPHCYGNAPKTELDYQLLADKRGYRWIGPKPPTAHHRSPWVCNLGHEFMGDYNSLSQGHGCPVCGKDIGPTKRRFTADQYHAVAVDHGYKWLGENVVNAMSKTFWQCPLGHIWQAPYSSIASGKGCRICSGYANKTQADYMEVALRRGFTFVGPMPESVITPALWRCDKGHLFMSRYSSVSRGRGCRFCASTLPKTADDYRRVAIEQNIEWLDESPPVNSRQKALWRCSNGHEFRALLGNVTQGHGCPTCQKEHLSRIFRKPPSEYHALARLTGLDWLGPEARRTSHFTNWKCPAGHEIRASYNAVSNKQGCRLCLRKQTADFSIVNGAPTSKPQRILHAMLGGKLNLPVGRYSIDVAIQVDGLNIAVEYDCWYWHKDHLDRDAQRDVALRDMGWRVLRIKTLTAMPKQREIEFALRRLVSGTPYVEIVMPGWGQS